MDKLPVELLRWIAQFTDAIGLGSWLRTSRFYYLALKEEIYVCAALRDRDDFDWPYHAFYAALKRQPDPLRRLLRHSKRLMDISRANIDVASLFPQFDCDPVFPWYSPPPVIRGVPRRTSLLHLVCGVCHQDLVECALAEVPEVAALSVGDSKGHTALHVAACRGNAPIVRWLVAAGADVDAVSNERKMDTALDVALDFKHRAAADALLDANANVGADLRADATLPRAISREDVEATRRIVNAGCHTETLVGCLCQASRARDPRLLRTFFEAQPLLLQAAVELQPRIRHYVLFVAVAAGRPENVRLLIDAGIDVRQRDTRGHTVLRHLRDVETAQAILESDPEIVFIKSDSGQTPLDELWSLGLARRQGDEVGQLDITSCATLLIEHGCELNPTPKQAWTLLHEMVDWGCLAGIKALLTKQPSLVHVRDERGQTALHWAACADTEDSLAYVKALVEFRCDVNSLDTLGQTALDCFLLPALSPRSRPRSTVARYLVRAGLDLSRGVHSQSTRLLETAIRDRDVELAVTLIDSGINLSMPPYYVNRPLNLAVGFGDVDVIASLQRAGLDITTSTISGGMSALHLAVREGQVDVVRYLLDNGLDPSAAREDGNTPLHIAAEAALHDKGEVEGYAAVLSAIMHGNLYVVGNDTRKRPALLPPTINDTRHIRILRLLCSTGRVDPFTVRNKQGLSAFDLVDRAIPSQGRAEVRKHGTALQTCRLIMFRTMTKGQQVCLKRSPN